ncbi:MAG: HEAT repeat domain-containing protein [Candidatus Hodarchaeota archaeon]
MKTILDYLRKDRQKEDRRQIIDYISNHEMEFEKVLQSTFSAESNEDFLPQKNRVIDLVDFLPPKISVPVIELAISDSSSKIRVRGLQAAYRTRVDNLNPKVMQILENKEEDFEARKWAVHILGSSDPDSFGRTIRRLAKNLNEDIRIRKEAVYALTKIIDDETIGALCALLGDSKVEMRRSGAWALSSISSPESIHCLLAALEDDDDEVRDWSIRALRDMDDSRALQGLADTLTRVGPKDQSRMIRLIVERRSEIVLRAIAELLSSENGDVRRTAAWAMGVSPYPPAAESLRILATDPDEQTRDYAKMALLRMGEIDASDLRL